MMGYRVEAREEILRKGTWIEQEDVILTAFVTVLGERRWDHIAKTSGLKRSGKSCRLRWKNYLRPNLKRGPISPEEERIVIKLHEQWGNKWSRIAEKLPGRTDNEIKNYWKTHLKKEVQSSKQGLSGAACQAPQSRMSNRNRDSSLPNAVYQCERKQECQDHFPIADSLKTTGSSLNVLSFSDFSCLNSPYEIRLLDWMSEFGNDANEVTCVACKPSGSCFCYPKWDFEGVDNSIWNCPGCLWE
ncbi:transcription factor MYB27-like [Rhodamnia argentea]|uniref:Transcription factor MYB27-like n=1 Tax=Rhodamnia argentea TaxID=178133 RepID=A0A8B8NHI5_9MYRT|nr:transcription factor MYB27-like [Rhodamnia argentea]